MDLGPEISAVLIPGPNLILDRSLAETLRMAAYHGQTSSGLEECARA